MSQPGPKSHYGPKEQPPVSILLTADAKAKLSEVVERTQASRADILEQLIRRFARYVRFRGRAGETEATK